MQKIIKHISCLVLLLGSSLAHGQQLPLYSQFMWNDYAINPAYTGSYNYSPVRLVYRKQWAGFNGSPTLLTFGGHTRLSDKISVGGLLFKDKTGGAISQTGALLNYAYRITMDDSSFFTLGLAAQLNQYAFDYNKVTALTPNDPALADGIEKNMSPDASFGVLYQKKDRLRLGASVNQLFETGMDNFNDAGGNNSLVRHYNVQGSYKIGSDSGFAFTPMMLFKMTEATPAQLDLTAKFDFKNNLWAACSYRSDDALVAMVGINSRNYFIGYSYDMTLSEIANYSSGSHEIVLGLNLSGNKKSPSSDRDKDGVVDSKDQCPDIAGVKENNGCPVADRDKDGVADALDQCPDVAGPMSNFGCPSSDIDRDGIPNNLDMCPDVFGVPENNGCPLADRDRDGIADFVDRCPDQPGSISNEGCPVADRDMDGVPDLYDQCPDLKGSLRNNGCPFTDTDQDGVADIHDRCPTLPGSISNNGCPDTRLDSDGDGIPNYLDECPNTIGASGNKGCPVVSKKQSEIVDKAISNLEFDFNASTIKSASNVGLDMLALMLEDKPDWKLKISGHTDAVGSEEYNLELSKKRAEAVRDYLVAKGVSFDRFIVEYFGKYRPISTNDTEIGRSKNRRVEMMLIFE
ncbi:MAG: PorP/SprF family type IX secretion system membrane protein [Arcticibacter sp.]